MEPGPAAHTGSAAPNSTTNHGSRFAILPPLIEVLACPSGQAENFSADCRPAAPDFEFLLDEELCSGGNRLLGDIVVHLYRQLIRSRFETRQGHALLECHLISGVADLIGCFYGVQHRLIGRRIDDVILKLCRRLLILVVDSEIIDLHPEIELLIPLELRRSTIGAIHARTNFRGAQYEHAGAYLLRRDLLHYVSKDQR